MKSLETLERRQRFTEQLIDSPYDAKLYLGRARCYQDLEFPDLAAGDAYKALLLTDEAQDDSGEYHDQALEAIELNIKREDHTNGSTDISKHITTYSLESYKILASSLLRCGCLRSSYDFCLRGLQLKPHDALLGKLKNEIIKRNKVSQILHDPHWNESTFDLKTDLADQGSVRRELYPWNAHEPDRFSTTSISFLNAQMKEVAPKCSVIAVALPLLTEDCSLASSETKIKQLGIFATEDIAPGETVLHESSLLTANNRLHDPLCDACSSELLPISLSRPVYACPDCDDTVFCSSKCLELASSSYHPAICGKDLDFVGREMEPKDTVHALYLLLLARVMALTESQDIHPLELKETKYIWGDFIHPDSSYVHSSLASEFTTARHLPFSFTYNVLSPLHILEKMDMDIYASIDKYDIWIFNTLYAKFRGTASARLNTRDGKPEVCAVHPMWSLANHSCAPNIRWEWSGEIQFWARNESDVVKWGPYRDLQDRRLHGGIKRGEEVLNHYCDVELVVKERREWAVGALGGMCVCERCLWEDNEEKERQV